ncbi:MAG TPA: arylamine N-acetyltransferase [Actinomycetota bacterium]|nr:arylamine N-acetyltransferase [Actinomycetota bacterium]
MELDLDAYLDRIGHRGPVEPTVACLGAVHLAHVSSIPFENLDILLGLPIRLDLESLQDKLVRRRRGGYCFEQNTLFAAVLEAIGFGVTRLAARVRLGRQGITPRTHMVLRVDAGGSEWLADVGFGGGSILAPLPFEPGPVAEQFAWRFRLVDTDGARVLQTLRPDGWLDYYGFTFEPQHPVDFELANHYTSTHPDSRFTRTLTAQLSSPERSLVLRGLSFAELTPSDEVVSRIEPDRLLEVLSSRFTLRLPEGTRFEVVDAAVSVPTSALGARPRRGVDGPGDRGA